MNKIKTILELNGFNFISLETASYYEVVYFEHNASSEIEYSIKIYNDGRIVLLEFPFMPRNDKPGEIREFGEIMESLGKVMLEIRLHC